MTTKKTNPQPADEAPAVSLVTDSQPLKGLSVEPVFRDRVFTSRTLILPDGSTAAVVAGKIAATNDMMLDFLTTDPDFEPLPR